MIDLHCHLLPGIDDGPSDIFAALDLARQAVENGVTHCVVTPHIHHGRWENTRNSIASNAQEFRAELINAKVPLALSYAAEVRISSEIMSMLPDDNIPFLGQWEGYKVILLEMPHSHILPGTDKIVTWLLKHGVLPMIAHPERNKDVMRRFDKLAPLIDLGCLFQVTSGSVTGQFGEDAQRRALKMLEMGLVTVLASDAHHSKRRPVNLKEGKEAAEKFIGKAEASKLVLENPLKIASEHFKIRSVNSESASRIFR